MFGFYRAFLAITVVLLHLYGIPRIGNYAVFAFFILSGFLMTMIMQDQYGYNSHGRIKFALNRALRLYPVYLYSAIISLILIFTLGGDFLVQYTKHIYLPTDFISIISNLTMIYPALIPHRVDPILSPATWAITVEIFYYALICIGISKTKKRVVIWLVVSVLYFIYAYYAKTATWRYSAIPAGSLPFAMGSMLFFTKESIYHFVKSIKVDSPFLWLFLFILNPFLANAFNEIYIIGEICIFFNLIIALILTCILYYRGFRLINKRWDSLFGEYSYPIYLLHYQAGALVTFFLIQNDCITSINSKDTSILAIPILFCLSYIGIHLIDRNVNAMRDRIRRQ